MQIQRFAFETIIICSCSWLNRIPVQDLRRSPVETILGLVKDSSLSPGDKTLFVVLTIFLIDALLFATQDIP